MTTPGEVTAAWASARVTELLGEHQDEPPAYGTAGWLALPADDPRRPAAILTAAEAWRRHVDEQARLDRLAEDDPDVWHAEVSAEADARAAQLGRTLAAAMTVRERADRATHRPPIPVRATPEWPVAIPGRPGWWRHEIDGEQVDLLGRHVSQQQLEAA